MDADLKYNKKNVLLKSNKNFESNHRYHTVTTVNYYILVYNVF